MRYLPNVLLVLSLPAGAVGYAVAVQVISIVMPGQSQGIVVLFVPLLVGGLCMLPFLIPYFDRRARQDLAAYRASQQQGTGERSDRPGPSGKAGSSTQPSPSDQSGLGPGPGPLG